MQMRKGRPEISLWRILELSYEAGGVYPTLVGYALGAIATLFFVGSTSWMLRLAPAAVCLMVFMHILHDLEQSPWEWLLSVSAITGVCCTYVQMASLELVREHFAFKKMQKHKKFD
ncbi:hypothetical protein BBJ28_00002622 [Nothophytophthora sp. Chile5]|nr:hypothetical protein BBJ28_00002622 [Nothophytophthora sp. Chile5]